MVWNYSWISDLWGAGVALGSAVSCSGVGSMGLGPRTLRRGSSRLLVSLKGSDESGSPRCWKNCIQLLLKILPLLRRRSSGVMWIRRQEGISPLFHLQTCLPLRPRIGGACWWWFSWAVACRSKEEMVWLCKTVT